MNKIYNEKYYREYRGPASYDDQKTWMPFFKNIAQNIVQEFSPNTVLDAGCAMGYLVAALRDMGVEAYGIDISQYAINKVREDIKPYCVAGSISKPLPENMPKKYDMVVTIEVLEHLNEDEGRLAILNLCSLTNRILFSSTPDVYDKTHLNVQKGEYWAGIFAEQGFFNEIGREPQYISLYAFSFEKRVDFAGQVREYERKLRLEHEAYLELFNSSVVNKIRSVGRLYIDIGNGYSEKEVIQLGNGDIKTKFKYLVDLPAGVRMVRFDPVDGVACIIKNLSFHTDRREVEFIQKNGNKIGDYLLFVTEDPQFEANLCGLTIPSIEISGEILFLDTKVALHILKVMELGSKELNEVYRKLSEKDEEIHSLKIKMMDNEKEALRYKNELQYAMSSYNAVLESKSWKITKPLRIVTGQIRRTMKSFKAGMLTYKLLSNLKHYGLKSTLKKVIMKLKIKIAPLYYGGTANSIIISKEERARQEHQNFADIKISILVPLYNTPRQFLNEMIESVKAQTYSNWELCLADGSDSEHNYVGVECRKAMNADLRIIYKFLGKNLGISENTNRCIELSTGEYLGLLDHDDLLHPSALYEVMIAICEKKADFIYTDENTFAHTPKDAYCPHFKPDFAPDNLRTQNYICHFTVFSRMLLKTVGTFRRDFDGSQDFDMVLRLTEVAKHIEHIPKILYFWRAHSKSVALDVGAKPYVIEAAKNALLEHLNRIGLEGTVLDSTIPSTYRIKYLIKGVPPISILIPNKDHVDDLRRCVESILERTSYPNYEIIIVDNSSIEAKTREYYDKLHSNNKVKIISWDNRFNFSAINNFGFRHASGEYILLLNNDTEVITKDWLQEMLMFAQRCDVGAVGAMLYYPDDTVQHAGIILGLLTLAGHSHRNFPRGNSGYMGRLTFVQNLSAVTAACMMVPRHVYEKVGGLDESFEVAFNDVDFCMRIRKAGYLIVFTPYAELYHCESKSRGPEDTLEKQDRFGGEVSRFKCRWKKELEAGDPYYNPNLTLYYEDFSTKRHNEFNKVIDSR